MLIVCPECEYRLSDTAPACPRCGWARAVVEATKKRSRRHKAGQKLVTISTNLMIVGLVVMFGGCGLGFASSTPEAIVGGILLGLGVLVPAAVVGQVGRAKQGRVV